MPVGGADSISAELWNELRDGLAERGSFIPDPVGVGQDVQAQFVLELRYRAGIRLDYFVNEDTGELWTLAAILEHLGLGQGSPRTWTDPTLAQGDPVRAVHFNELEAVVKELRWPFAAPHADSIEWRKARNDEPSAVDAYMNSKSESPMPYGTRLVGHEVDSYLEDGETLYRARRFRFSLAYDTSAIPDGAVLGGAKMSLRSLPDPFDGRAFNVKTYAKLSSSWDLGTYRGQASTGSAGLIPLEPGDVNKSGLSYFLLSCDREEADDQPATGDDEFIALDNTTMWLLWRRDDYAFK